MPKIIASVKALIQYRDTYLVLKAPIHKGDVWDLPGGKIEYGETPYEALIREVKEETCLSVTIDRSLGAWWFYSKNHRHEVICHTFLCTPVGEVNVDLTHNPAVDEDISAFYWETKQDLLDQNKYELEESLKEIIRKLE